MEISDLNEDEDVMISIYSILKRLDEVSLGAKTDSSSRRILLEAISDRERRATGEKIELGAVMNVKEAKEAFGSEKPQILCKV